MKNTATHPATERRVRPSDPSRREPLERRTYYVSALVENTDGAIRALIPDIDLLPEVTGIVPEPVEQPIEQKPAGETVVHIAQSVLGGDGVVIPEKVETSSAIGKNQRIENALQALYDIHHDVQQEGADVTA